MMSFNLTAKKYLVLCVLTMAAILMPQYIPHGSAQDITAYQFGQSFSCSGGSGQMITGTGCSGSPADGQIFSYFVCKFEDILNQALSKVYCAINEEAKPAVMAALTMAVLFFGMMFLMGVSPFTAKELMLFAGKFSLVLAFATQAEYMIGIGYALFMNVAKEGIVIVLNYLFEGNYSTASDVYKMFDEALKEMMGLASQDSKQEGGQCQNAIFSMMVLAAAALPPLAFIGVYFLFKLAWVMLRAVFGYCQGILGVTFLVTLAPIYVSFALFKPTRSLFDKWVQYLISFSFQMVVVFAFLGMAFSIMKRIADDVSDYTQLVKPYNQKYSAPGVANVFDMCGVCEIDKVGPKEKPRCKSDKVMEIGQLAKDENFLHFASVKIFAMIIMFYILDIMMDFVPQMARYLAGPKYAGQLGGGDYGDPPGGKSDVNMELPGERNIRGALEAGTQAFSRAGTTPGGFVAGFTAAAGRLVTDTTRDLTRDAVGIGAAVGIHGALRGNRPAPGPRADGTVERPTHISPHATRHASAPVRDEDGTPDRSPAATRVANRRAGAVVEDNDSGGDTAAGSRNHSVVLASAIINMRPVIRTPVGKPDGGVEHVDGPDDAYDPYTSIQQAIAESGIPQDQIAAAIEDLLRDPNLTTREYDALIRMRAGYSSMTT